MKLLLQLGGLMHFAVLGASAMVPRVFDWRRNLAPLHPFLRQLFWVYGIFIVLVIISFGTLSLVNAASLAAGTLLARSVCAMIALFWAVRLAVQFFVFDPAPFLKTRFLRLGYHLLTVVFIIMVALYGAAALQPSLIR